jgi:predicted nuclease of predicted toxin-antitoxin system
MPPTCGTGGCSERQTPKCLSVPTREDRLLVTLNVDDFVRLVRARDLHAGIVLIERSGLTREEQLDVVRRALALIIVELEAGRDMVNRVLWIDLSVHSFEQLPR